RVTVVEAAGEVVAELVNEQNREKSKSERQSGDERERMSVEEGESIEEFVEVDGFVFGVGGGEVSAGDEAGAERHEEKNDREQQSLQGKMRGDDRVPRRGGNVLNRLPVAFQRF